MDFVDDLISNIVNTAHIMDSVNFHLLSFQSPRTNIDVTKEIVAQTTQVVQPLKITTMMMIRLKTVKLMKPVLKQKILNRLCPKQVLVVQKQ